MQIHNLEDCPSKEDFFFRDLVTSQISYGEIKDEPSSYQAGVLIVVSFFLCFTGLIHVEIELHTHRQMPQDLSQPKEEKLELQNTTEDERHKILRTDSDESRFDQISLMDTLTEENEKRKMASSSSTWERRFSMEFTPGLKGFERKFKCPYL